MIVKKNSYCLHFCTDAFVFLWSLTGGQANRVWECLQISWCPWCECFWFPPSSDRLVISTSRCCRVGVGPLSRTGDSPVWFYWEEPGELEIPGRKPPGSLRCLLLIYQCLYSCRQRGRSESKDGMAVFLFPALHVCGKRERLFDFHIYRVCGIQMSPLSACLRLPLSPLNNVVGLKQVSRCGSSQRMSEAWMFFIVAPL